jgi:hypothetical protein
VEQAQVFKELKHAYPGIEFSPVLLSQDVLAVIPYNQRHQYPQFPWEEESSLKGIGLAMITTNPRSARYYKKYLTTHDTPRSTPPSQSSC